MVYGKWGNMLYTLLICINFAASNNNTLGKKIYEKQV